MHLLSFIILTWNSEKYLKVCFDSIISSCTRENISFEVIAVDNGSSDTSVSIIQHYTELYPDNFKLLALDSNRGTTYPRNLGLKQAVGEYICILDSDTELGEGSLKKVLMCLATQHDIGILAPRLLLPDGSVQNSVKRFPTMLDKLFKVPRIVINIKTQDTDFYKEFPFKTERDVDTAISACWFIRREHWDKVGDLDEMIFYAPEDLDYSVRVWKAGFRILYYPLFTVLHHTQQITHRKPLSKTSLSHFRGLLYYYLKHGGWFIRHRV
jgi:GT2 family glycosyltransferase